MNTMPSGKYSSCLLACLCYGLTPFTPKCLNKRVGDFRNDVVAEASPLLLAALATQRLLCGRGRSCWLAHVHTAMTALHPPAAGCVVADRPMALTLPDILHACTKRHREVWEGFKRNPRHPDCPNRRHATYFSWFHGTDTRAWQHSPHVPVCARRDFTHFVLGHPVLRVVAGALPPHRVPWEQRGCRLCDCIGHEVEDELHVLFNCTQLDVVREDFEETCLAGVPMHVRATDFRRWFAVASAHADFPLYLHKVLNVYRSQNH